MRSRAAPHCIVAAKPCFFFNRRCSDGLHFVMKDLFNMLYCMFACLGNLGNLGRLHHAIRDQSERHLEFQPILPGTVTPPFLYSRHCGQPEGWTQGSIAWLPTTMSGLQLVLSSMRLRWSALWYPLVHPLDDAPSRLDHVLLW